MLVSFSWSGAAKPFIERELPSVPRKGEVVSIGPNRPGASPRLGCVMSVTWELSYMLSSCRIDVSLVDLTQGDWQGEKSEPASSLARPSLRAPEILGRQGTPLEMRRVIRDKHGGRIEVHQDLDGLNLVEVHSFDAGDSTSIRIPMPWEQALAVAEAIKAQAEECRKEEAMQDVVARINGVDD